MRKSTIINIIVILLLVCFEGKIAFANPQITADAAAVIDVKSGLVVYEKNGHQQRVPASLTKMMTAIIAAEFGDLNQDVTIGNRPPAIPPSKIYLRQGEKIKLDYLLKAALMKSANDACVAIAEHVAGEEEYFVYLMNLKSWSLALHKTHFRNTNGLPASNHYSTAIDLARIGMYAKSIPVINEYVSRKNDVIIRRGKEQKIGNTNKFLWSYPGANGIKTGTTNAAGKCLASSASINQKEFIGIVLHSDNRYGDSSKILNYAFGNIDPKKIMSYNQKLFVPLDKGVIIGKVYKDIYYPYKTNQNIKVYVKTYDKAKDYSKGDKCGLLAVVTPDSILWYDIYAIENKQNLTANLNIFDYFLKFMMD